MEKMCDNVDTIRFISFFFCENEKIVYRFPSDIKLADAREEGG